MNCSVFLYRLDLLSGPLLVFDLSLASRCVGRAGSSLPFQLMYGFLGFLTSSKLWIAGRLDARGAAAFAAGARSGLFLILLLTDLSASFFLYLGLSNIILAVLTGCFSTKGVCTLTLIWLAELASVVFYLSGDVEALCSISNLIDFNCLKAIKNC